MLTKFYLFTPPASAEDAQDIQSFRVYEGMCTYLTERRGPPPANDTTLVLLGDEDEDAEGDVTAYTVQASFEVADAFGAIAAYCMVTRETAVDITVLAVGAISRAQFLAANGLPADEPVAPVGYPLRDPDVTEFVVEGTEMNLHVGKRCRVRQVSKLSTDIVPGDAKAIGRTGIVHRTCSEGCVRVDLDHSLPNEESWVRATAIEIL